MITLTCFQIFPRTAERNVHGVQHHSALRRRQDLVYRKTHAVQTCSSEASSSLLCSLLKR